MDIGDAPVVDVARRQVFCCDEVSQPLRGVFVVFVVVRGLHLRKVNTQGEAKPEAA